MRIIRAPLEMISPVRQMKNPSKNISRYQAIVKSIQEIGLAEPLMIYPQRGIPRPSSGRTVSSLSSRRNSSRLSLSRLWSPLWSGRFEICAISRSALLGNLAAAIAPGWTFLRAQRDGSTREPLHETSALQLKESSQVYPGQLPDDCRRTTGHGLAGNGRAGLRA
jgi:hypothetical protein